MSYKTPVFPFGSHLPVLIRVVQMTSGSILEMGTGMCSTLFLHWACATSKRELVSYENDLGFYQREIAKMQNDYHQVLYVDDWDEALIERPWDVAFLDHGPAERRVVDIKRLASLARMIVIHDSEGRSGVHFGYHAIFPLFRWQFNYDDYLPHTTVLSNFHDLQPLADHFTTERNRWPHA